MKITLDKSDITLLENTLSEKIRDMFNWELFSDDYIVEPIIAAIEKEMTGSIWKQITIAVKEHLSKNLEALVQKEIDKKVKETISNLIK